jgi:putative cell wall-binding protein
MKNKLVVFASLFILIVSNLSHHTVVLAEKPVRKVESLHKKAHLNMVKYSKKTIFNKEIIIKANKYINLSGYEVTPIETTPFMKKKGYTVVKVNNEKNIAEVISKLKKNKNVLLAEPNYVTHTLNNIINPNDQYALTNTKLKTANTFSTSNEVKIAVLDSGLNMHDLFNGLKRIEGYNVETLGTDITDIEGHGTFVSGLISLSGKKENTTLLPIKVTDQDGYIPVSASIEGIYKAIELGADVINMSYGSTSPSNAEYAAILDAYYQHGIVIVASSGNNGDDEFLYPASYPEVISVGATNSNDAITSFSSFNDAVDLAAPGEEIISASDKNSMGFVTGDGTSFSAPFVSSLASLIRLKHSDHSPQQIEYMMEKSAFIPAEHQQGWNSKYGYGRINADGAFNVSLPDNSSDIPDELYQSFHLVIGAIKNEKLLLPNDVDYYSVNVPFAGQMKIDLNGTQNLDLALWYQSEEGDLVSTTIDDGYLGENETTVIPVKPGNYSIAVYDNNGHWSEDNYQLKTSMFPSVGWINDKDTKVLGKATPGSMVYIKNGSETYSAPVAQDGTFSINTPKFLPGTNLVIYSVDSQGNNSPSVTKSVIKHIERIDGKDRFEVAVNLSKKGWETGSDSIILSNYLAYADALTAGPFAYKQNAPILLTHPQQLTEVTKTEISRLKTKKAYVVGGSGSISENVINQLKQMGISVERIGGNDRFEVSVNIAKKLANKGKAIIANGLNFPDALAISPYASKNEFPILLTRPLEMPKIITDQLRDKGISSTIVVGGDASVSQGVFNRLPQAIRIGGKDRYEVAANVIYQLGLNKDRIAITTGLTFADALTGSVYAAKYGMPLLLTRSNALPPPIEQLINNNKVRGFQIYGGKGSVSESIEFNLPYKP